MVRLVLRVSLRACVKARILQTSHLREIPAGVGTLEVTVFISGFCFSYGGAETDGMGGPGAQLVTPSWTG